MISGVFMTHTTWVDLLIMHCSLEIWLVTGVPRS